MVTDEEFRKLEERVSKLEKIFVPTQDSDIQKSLSVKEFLLSKNPKSDVEKTLAIGYFLEKYRSISPFNINDLKNGFSESREPIPSNLNARINDNILRGLIMESTEKKDNQKAFLITNSGEKLITNNFKELSDN